MDGVQPTQREATVSNINLFPNATTEQLTLAQLWLAGINALPPPKFQLLIAGDHTARNGGVMIWSVLQQEIDDEIERRRATGAVSNIRVPISFPILMGRTDSVTVVRDCICSSRDLFNVGCTCGYAANKKAGIK